MKTTKKGFGLAVTGLFASGLLGLYACSMAGIGQTLGMFVAIAMALLVFVAALEHLMLIRCAKTCKTLLESDPDHSIDALAAATKSSPHSTEQILKKLMFRKLLKGIEINQQTKSIVVEGEKRMPPATPVTPGATQATATGNVPAPPSPETLVRPTPASPPVSPAPELTLTPLYDPAADATRRPTRSH